MIPPIRRGKQTIANIERTVLRGTALIAYTGRSMMNATEHPLTTLTQENVQVFREFIYKFVYEATSHEQTTAIMAIMVIARYRPELVPHAVHFSYTLDFLPRFFAGIFKRPVDYNWSMSYHIFCLATTYCLKKKITIEEEMMCVPKKWESEAVRAAQEEMLADQFETKKDELRRWRIEQFNEKVGGEFAALNQKNELLRDIIVNLEDRRKLDKKETERLKVQYSIFLKRRKNCRLLCEN